MKGLSSTFVANSTRSSCSQERKQQRYFNLAIGFGIVACIGISIYFGYFYTKMSTADTTNKDNSVDTKMENKNNGNNNNNECNSNENNNNNNNNNNSNSNTDPNNNSNTNSNSNTNNNSPTKNENNNNNNNNNNDSTNNDKGKTKSKSKKKKSKKDSNKNKNNSNNNNKESDSEDEVKISGKKDDSGLKTASSYYHFKSTDPKVAEQFKPKKIEDGNEVTNNAAGKPGASAWNTGATMETFDYTEWVFDQIKTQLCNIEFNKTGVKITEVESIDGHATIIFSRGKLRPGFDINFKAKYSGKFEDKDVEGTISMNDICLDDDEDDWEYEVSSKKGGAAGKKVARMIKNYRDTVIGCLHVIFEEFKNKKK